MGRRRSQSGISTLAFLLRPMRAQERVGVLAVRRETATVEVALAADALDLLHEMIIT